MIDSHSHLSAAAAPQNQCVFVPQHMINGSQLQLPNSRSKGLVSSLFLSRVSQLGIVHSAACHTPQADWFGRG